MRNPIAQFIAYISVGVIINLVVAWGCAMLLPLEGDWPTYRNSWASGERAEAYLRRMLREITQAPEDHPILYSDSERGFGWTRSSTDLGHVYGGGIVSAGWPLRTLHGAVLIGPAGREDYVHALLLPAGSSDRKLLPLHPLWLGTITNTFLYAGILWFCARRIAAGRRVARLRRGLCPGCGYPIGESPTCSECGGALPKYDVGKRSPLGRG